MNFKVQRTFQDGVVEPFDTQHYFLKDAKKIAKRVSLDPIAHGTVVVINGDGTVISTFINGEEQR